MRGPDDTAGFALPVVLWVLTLLAVASWSHTETSRLSIASVAARAEIAAARSAAEAGIPLALATIDGAVRAGRPMPRGLACRFGAARLRVWIEDEAGKIDVNRVSADALVAAFEALGLGPSEAERLAERLAAHRGRRPAQPGARRLESLGDLARIPGGEALDLDKAARHLTVLGARQVDPAAASPLVLAVVRALGADARGYGPSPQRAASITVAADTGRASYAVAVLVEIGRPVVSTARIVARARVTLSDLPASPDPPEGALC